MIIRFTSHKTMHLCFKIIHSAEYFSSINPFLYIIQALNLHRVSNRNNSVHQQQRRPLPRRRSRSPAFIYGGQQWLSTRGVALSYLIIFSGRQRASVGIISVKSASRSHLARAHIHQPPASSLANTHTHTHTHTHMHALETKQCGRKKAQKC